MHVLASSEGIREEKGKNKKGKNKKGENKKGKKGKNKKGKKKGETGPKKGQKA